MKLSVIKRLMLISVFKSSIMFFVKLDVPEFGTYMFRIIKSPWITVPLIRIKCLSISFDYFYFEVYFVRY